MASSPVFTDYPALAGLLPFFIFIYMALALWAYFGFQFIGKSALDRENPAQKSYFRGFGMFVVVVALLEGLYVLGQITSIFAGFDLFWTTIRWQDYLRQIYGMPTFQLNTLWNNDYWILMTTLVIFSLSFLTRPLEKFMLGNQSAPLATACIVLSPMHVIVRIFEINFYGWFGVELTTTALATSIFYILEIAVTVVIVFAFLVVVYLYYKMAMSAPKGSALRRKSWEVEIGLFIWLFALFSTSLHQNFISATYSLYPNILPIAWVLPFLTGFYMIIALLLMSSGMRRDYTS